MQKLGHINEIYSVAFSPNSKLLASSSKDKAVWLWEVETGMCFQKLEGHTDWITSVSFSPDSKLLASTSHYDTTVRLWEVNSGACIQEISGIMTFLLQFDTKEPCIHTDVGTISLPRCTLSNGYRAKTLPQCLFGIGISYDRCWIMWQENRLLWLPLPFRANCSAVSGSTVVIGCDSGRVIFMKFRDPGL